MNAYGHNWVLLDLTRDEFDSLMLALGYATGAAVQQGDDKFARSWTRVANAVNRGNPNYTPYEVPEESTDANPV